MIIEKIHIDAFGRLENRDFELSEGVNIIEGANESGKSTLAAFIRFVFYGCSPREREAALSWKSGGASGSITLTEGNRRYRIERVMVGSREAVQLIDAATNMPIRGALDGVTPGELFFGVDADMFAATAFVSQLGAAPGGAKVSEGIENILFSADESVNTQKALAKLDSARAALLHKNEKGGRLFELDNACAALEVRLNDALTVHRDIQTKEAQLSDMRGNLAAAEAKAQTVGAKVSQFEAVTVLGLFERMKTLEKKTSELRAAIDKAGAPDPDYVNRVGGLIERIAMLRKEYDDATARRDADMPPEMGRHLREYVDAGGRESLEDELDTVRSAAKTYRMIGVIFLLLGIGVLALGLLPLTGGGAPGIGFIVAGALAAALAVTLFVLGGRAGARANELADTYDFDALESEHAAYLAASEKAKFNELTATETRRRFDEARAEAKRLTGVEADALEAHHRDLQDKMHDVDGLKAEYDKHAVLLAHMREQLGSYNEEELQGRLDPSVDVSDIDASSLPALRREAEVASKMAAALTKHSTELERTLAGLYPTAEDPTRLTDKLGALRMEREELAKKHAAYKLACEKLTEASEHLRESLSPRLAADAAKRMEEITDGRYSELGVGTSLEMTARTEGGLRPLEALSAGTQDAAYLSLRIALVNLLYRKALPPMLYDESFARQDDSRLEKLLRMIHGQEIQSLIFTSNGRDAAMMKKIGEYRTITL